ncbi:MAG: CHASE2 domain-containing protein [Thermodesulfobacteriota bacterium]
MPLPQQQKLSKSVWIILLISLLAMVGDGSGFLDILERKSIDLRMQLTRSETPLPDDIAIVLIDDASLHALDPLVGRWPWPRDVHAELIDFLRDCGARAVVMDILFTQHQKVGLDAADGLSEPDRRLAESTREAAMVFHAAQLVMDDPDSTQNEPLPRDFTERFSLSMEGAAELIPFNQYYLPFEELYPHAAGVGVVTFVPDRDGVFRSEALVFDYRGNRLPSLGLAAALINTGSRSAFFREGDLFLRKAEGDIRIPLTKDGEYYLHLYGRYPAFSISGVLKTKWELDQGNHTDLPFRPEEFKGKTVFVGASAAGAQDLKMTSLGSILPGVMLQASVYANIMTGDFLRFAAFPITAPTVLLAAALTLWAVLFFRNVTLRAVVPVLVMALFYGVCLYLFRRNWVMNVTAPSVAFLSAYISGFVFTMATEGRERRRIRNILGQYVSPAMLRDVLEHYKEDYFRAEVGSKEVLTVFFSDIRGFTSISETHQVEMVVALLNRYLSKMVAIIFEHQGTLDKFIGDAIVAFWGAPVKIEDHAHRAVLSALQMRRALEELNRENEAEGMPPLKIGIGIHTGEVILGNIGSEKKLDYTVIGDSVNLTSRLEGLTKTYGCTILVSQDTHDRIKDRIVCRLADYVKVKGKRKPIAIFEVLDETGSVDPELRTVVALSEQAFSQYRERRFPEAIATYERIRALRPRDVPAELFIARCRHYLENPPPEDWDGFYAHQSK